VVATLSVYIPGDWRSGDVTIYHIYAVAFWNGLPHPLLPAEYPPLAILPFSVTLAGPPDWYPDVFAFWMGALFIVGWFCFRKWTTPREAAAYAFYLLAAGSATLLFRYDLLPALVTVGALWSAQRNHFRASYALVAFGTLLKLFPIILLPVVAIAHWRGRRDADVNALRHVALAAGGCLAMIAAGFLVAAIFDPARGLSALTFDLKRPTEVESVPATLLWLGSLAGISVRPAAGSSLNLIGALSDPIGVVAIFALGAGVLWVFWRQIHGHITAGQAAVAMLLVLLCSSKVLSAQYLIWLAPLLATTVGFEMRWFALCLMTALIFPGLWDIGVHERGPTIAYGSVLLVGIAVRNALLIYLTARFLVAPGIDRASERIAEMPRVPLPGAVRA